MVGTGKMTMMKNDDKLTENPMVDTGKVDKIQTKMMMTKNHEISMVDTG